MKLTENNQKEILSNFPLIVPSYQNIPNKKAHSIYMAIPMGKKCYLWFTYYHDKPICLILILENKNKECITSIHNILCCFNEELCLENGTILYGTHSIINKLNNFIVEDIYLYKGKSVIKQNLIIRLNFIVEIFENYLNSKIFNREQFIFSLPLLNKNYYLLKKSIESNCIYKVFNILQKTIYGNYIQEIKYINKKVVLNVLADNQEDIYNLYTNNNDFIGFACINDYKTSVMMNKIFRNIKENDRLDSLEESDDEEEFENINLDKYIVKKNFVKMECIFNTKFKKWIPIKISKERVVENKNEIFKLLK